MSSCTYEFPAANNSAVITINMLDMLDMWIKGGML